MRPHDWARGAIGHGRRQRQLQGVRAVVTGEEDILLGNAQAFQGVFLERMFFLAIRNYAARRM